MTEEKSYTWELLAGNVYKRAMTKERICYTLFQFHPYRILAIVDQIKFIEMFPIFILAFNFGTALALTFAWRIFQGMQLLMTHRFFMLRGNAIIKIGSCTKIGLNDFITVCF